MTQEAQEIMSEIDAMTHHIHEVRPELAHQLDQCADALEKGLAPTDPRVTALLTAARLLMGAA